VLGFLASALRVAVLGAAACASSFFGVDSISFTSDIFLLKARVARAIYI
jgi:hypothetical protein